MAKNKVEYRLAPKAMADMESVWLYSLTQWGAEQTEHYIDDLTEAFTFLAENPKTGTLCEHIRQGYRRHSVIRHVIYYRETGYGIEIMRVLHDRMLAPRHFDSFHGLCENSCKDALRPVTQSVEEGF